MFYLSQSRTSYKLITGFFWHGGCKPILTPQIPSSKLLPLATTDSEPAKLHYWRAVGLLNYLVACPRPDLAYSASSLSQFLSFPSHDHELAFMHVLRYLKGTSTWGLWLGRRGDNSSIVAYCDSDWGLNYDSRSFSGSCVFLYGISLMFLIMIIYSEHE
ncbi:hypothetical protein O181_021145 [Austropuccinia psidii MF-1]|uniref:Reverse transcriptase Ty1/copia-type domain-containing protein n=1 Tax=Austropuccinia psidii MF-1 TaxID=1389203 RepID=A0A9Q3CE26_9BASI|nr:hypothetical protein [Austropuccinia psidii MF-1]